MGMTNEQFDAYKKGLLRQLEVVKKEVEKDGKSEMLDNLMKDLEEQLRRA